MEAKRLALDADVTEPGRSQSYIGTLRASPSPESCLPSVLGSRDFPQVARGGTPAHR